jgi:hypothetical protein
MLPRWFPVSPGYRSGVGRPPERERVYPRSTARNRKSQRNHKAAMVHESSVPSHIIRDNMAAMIYWQHVCHRRSSFR